MLIHLSYHLGLISCRGNGFEYISLNIFTYVDLIILLQCCWLIIISPLLLVILYTPFSTGLFNIWTKVTISILTLYFWVTFYSFIKKRIYNFVYILIKFCSFYGVSTEQWLESFVVRNLKKNMKVNALDMIQRFLSIQEIIKEFIIWCMKATLPAHL